MSATALLVFQPLALLPSAQLFTPHENKIEALLSGSKAVWIQSDLLCWKWKQWVISIFILLLDYIKTKSQGSR